MSNNITLQKLFLTNFKKHEALAVDFSPNITAIRGPNYAGKSSVLQAVLCAMFGVTAVPGGSSVVRRKDAKSYSITLEFDIDGKPGKVVRTSTTAAVSIDNDVVATGNSVVSAWFESAFGMDQKMVMLLAYSEQGETAALPTLGASSLNSIIEKVANTTYVDELAAKAGNVVNECVKAMAGCQPKGNLSEMEEALEALTSEVAQLEEKVTESSAKLLDLDSRYNEAVEEAREARALVAAYHAKQASHKASLERLEKVNSELSKHKTAFEASGGAARMAELKNAIQNLKEVLKSADTHNVDARVNNQRIKDVQAKADKVSNWLSTKGAELKEKAAIWLPLEAAAREKVSTIQVEIDAAKAEIAKLVNSLSEVDRELQNSECSKCKRPFDVSHSEKAKKDKEELKAKLEEANASLSLAMERMVPASLELSKIVSNLPTPGWEATVDRGMNELQLLRSELETLGEPVNLIQTDDMQSEVKDKEIQLNALNMLTALIANTEPRLKEAEEDVKKYSEISEVLIDVVPLEMEVTRLKELLELHRKENVELKLNWKSSTLNLQNLKSEVAEEAQRVEKYGKYEKRKARFEAFQKWLRTNKAAFMENVWASILATCSDFVAQVTSNRVTEISRDNDGVFYFTEEGDTLPMVAASGGQKAIAGVGLRIALAGLLPQACRFVLMDEPSAELNDEHAAALAGALRGQDRQVVLVTHREGDEFAADHVVML